MSPLRVHRAFEDLGDIVPMSPRAGRYWPKDSGWAACHGDDYPLTGFGAAHEAGGVLSHLTESNFIHQ